MNKNKGSLIDFRPEEGGIDKIKKTLQDEGAYICKGEDGSDIYNFHGCTVLVYENKITFGAKLRVTKKHSKLQLEELADVNMEEIKWE